MRKTEDKSANPTDLAGKEFWNSLWQSKSKVTREIGEPRLLHWEIQHAEFFDRAFAAVGPTAGKEILEIGAGDSGWLAYFSKRWGLRVTGLDYSPVGCDRASELLQRAGVQGEIVLGDMFDPPASLRDRFDIILTIGVVEHYKDTAGTVRAISACLKPGGVMVTTVPNIPGLVGDLFRILNKPVFDIHEPLDEQRLRAAHETAGLETLDAGNFMSLNLGVPNLAGLPSGFGTLLKKPIVAGLIVLSRMVWWLEERIGRFPVHRYFSPYVYVVARKPLT
jgi:2-polyprenyl-3-methyl-5-hydroxy-6-metoxy-1,4-benzoquinol methylase